MARYSFNLSEIGQRLSATLVIVMPIYNEEANITEVIASWSECLGQLGVSYQIIALDDGSRDQTHDILLQIEAAHPDTICVVSKPNGGHGSTCRIGYDIAVRSRAEW